MRPLGLLPGLLLLLGLLLGEMPTPLCSALALALGLGLALFCLWVAFPGRAVVPGTLHGRQATAALRELARGGPALRPRHDRHRSAARLLPLLRLHLHVLVVVMVRRGCRSSGGSRRQHGHHVGLVLRHGPAVTAPRPSVALAQHRQQGRRTALQRRQVGHAASKRGGGGGGGHTRS